MAPEGINASIDFLEKNPDFSAAHGRYISFYLKNKKNKKPDFLWRPTYHENSILSPDVAERMANHVKNYKPTFYAVHRSDFIKMIFGEVARSGINPFLFGEMLPSMITAVYGKIKNLNVFYAAKQKFSSFGGSWPTLTNAMKQGTYNEEYQKFKDCLVYHLRKNSFLEEDQLKSSVDNSMSGYLNRYYLTADYKKEIADKLGISSRLYKKIRIFSKTILGLNKNMWRESFKGTGLDNFSVELERIRGIVLSSDENEAKSLS